MPLDDQLTAEQRKAVGHPKGNHARVLAVAGSGKTTTLANFLVNAVENHEVDPKRVLVLMYNRLAREQFKTKLAQLHGPDALPPRVFTFHALAYQAIELSLQNGWLPGPAEFWIDDKEELETITMLRTLERLESASVLRPNEIDVDEALDAVHSWKGSLIPPKRAGYRGNTNMPVVYREFEKERITACAFTFDDFVPQLVSILENESGAIGQFCGKHDLIVIDEYQDINHAQHRLVELLSDGRADLVVVGDDDQTIYEWRGARPRYIREFGEASFQDKPCRTYQLTLSFRFGPAIADAAGRCIAKNQLRVPKSLRSFFPNKKTPIAVFQAHDDRTTDPNRELTETAESLIRDHVVEGSKIAVLGRLFSQLSSLESCFLRLRVPYRVIGRAPFFKRGEIQSLLAYFRLALALDQRVEKEHTDWLLKVANHPSRYLPRRVMEKDMRAARGKRLSIREAIDYIVENDQNGLKPYQRENLVDLQVVLLDLHDELQGTPAREMGDLARELVNEVRYLKYFDDYYGQGVASEDRKLTVLKFLEFADGTGLHPAEFLEYVDGLDTTLGRPEEEQVIFTTVFRTKGLEYEYVMIPDCNEGNMPCLKDEAVPTFDKEGLVVEEAQSPAIERERRLFYVAVTRAKSGVYISANAEPTTADSQSKSGVAKPSQFLREAGLLKAK